jgi:tubulin polyglutamylase TTLL4
VKPLASTHGKGVRILTDTTTVPTKGILEKYIYNPHLIKKRKYDMRIYVLVTGFRPLKIYIYDNGLVRFCSEKYTTDADKLNNTVTNIKKQTNVDIVELNTIDNLTDEQRKNKEDYISLLNENIDLLKNELYN